MADLKLKFKMPDDETLAEYISIKGEKGDPGDPTKTSQLENDSDFTTNAALNSGLATKADATTVQSLTTQVDANTDAIEGILSTRIEFNGSGLKTPRYYKIATFPYKNDSGNRSSLGIHGRIGRYQAEDIASLDIVLGNRGAYYAFGDYYSRYANVLADLVDIVVYEGEDTSATAYLKCTNWYAVALDLRFAGCTNEFDGTFSTNEPSGTLVWSLSSDTRVQKNINGVIYADIDGDAQTVNSHTVQTDVPYGAVFTDTVYDDTALREEVDLKADSDAIAEIYATKQEVHNLINATPTPVSSTSQMIDTTKIYVNTTDGYWYYYNGSEWTRGGIYQGVEDSDTVKGLVYNQINENLKYLMGFVIGNMNSTGNVTSGNSWLVTPNTIKFNYDIYIPYDSYVEVDIHTFNDDGTYIGHIYNVANNNKGYNIKAGTNFRLKLNYVTTPSPLPDLTTDTIENSLLFQNFKIMPFSVYKQLQFAKLRAEGYSENPENLKYSLELAIADIGSTGVQYAYNNFRRLATVDVLHYGFDIVIPKTSDYEVYLWQYTDETGAGATGKGWLSLTDTDYVIQAGTYFRLLFTSHRSSTTPLYDIYDNGVFKSFELYKRSETSNTIQHNPNMLSIAHQGYATDGLSVNYNRLSGYYNAGEHGFDAGECDIKWTSDQVPVCLHDNTFTDDDNVSVTISNVTFSELRTHLHDGEPIASFDEICKACKEMGLLLVVDHFANFYTTERNNIMFGIIKKYQMQDKVIYLVGNNRIALSNDIKTFYKKSKIAITVNTADLTTTISEANQMIDDNCEIYINFNYTNISVETLLTLLSTIDNRVKLGIWTVDDATTYKQYLPYVSAITSNRLCYNDVYEDLLS